MRYPHVKVVPIISTCSTEVIGDDIDGVVTKLNAGLLQEKYAGREVHLIPIHTPSFVGSMVSGYDVAVRDFVTYFAQKGKPNGRVNLITGWVNPGDVSALKHLLREMQVDATVLFEIEEFDSPLMPYGNTVSHGNTTIDDLRGTANAMGTIALNRYEGAKAAHFLETTFDVPAIVGPTPIGIRNTDTFLQNLKKMTGKPIPPSLVRERGIAIDALTDVTHMFLADKRVAIYGNPDLVIGLAEFCLDLEMKPVLLLLGDDNANYQNDPRIKAIQASVDFDMEIITNADLLELDSRLKSGLEVDLILGHSKGRFVAIDNKVPMFRVGFPTYDRAGLYRQPIVGYAGATWLAEQMANTLFTDMEYKGNKEWILNMW
jgi:nitrogenase molybdenum-iron protein beta chain